MPIKSRAHMTVQEFHSADNRSFQVWEINKADLQNNTLINVTGVVSGSHH